MNFDYTKYFSYRISKRYCFCDNRGLIMQGNREALFVRSIHICLQKTNDRLL